MSTNKKKSRGRQGSENRKYSLEDYKRVLALRRAGHSYNDIAKTQKVSCATVQYWMKTERRPRVLYVTRKQQRQMKESSKMLSKDLAYIYGVLIGDGFLENYSKRVCLQVSDKEFAQRFSITLEKWSGFKPTWSESFRKHNRKTKYGNLINATSHYYTVRLGSRQIFEFLQSKIRCRTKDWTIPKEIRGSGKKIIVSSFLQGVFDSEGFPVFQEKYNVRRIELEMWGKQLEQIQNLLLKLDIESTIISGKRGLGRGTYILRILKRDSVLLFARHINFTIERKRKKLLNMLD